MAAYQITVLGGFDLRSSDGDEILLPTRKDRLLLAYLALYAGQKQSRDRLAGLFWADRGEAQARGSLRQSLAALREAFRSSGGADPLTADRETVTVNPDAISIDALEFARLAAEPDTAGRAACMYRGELLAGLDAPTPEFEQWLKPERQKFEDLAAGLVERVAASGPKEPTARDAIELGRRLLARDRLREPVYRALMRMLADQGDRAQALKLLASCRDALKEDLGIEPDLETGQLYRDILTDTHGPPIAPDRAEEPEVHGERPSLAVMPFANIAGDTALNPLCEGLTEDVITGLGRFKLLFVIDRNSSAAVSQLTSDTSEFARRLGVSFLVQGSLQRLGDRTRITVRLVNPSSRTQMWANTFDCDVADVLGVPDKVTMAIVAMLHSRVETSLLDRSRRKPELAAYECVLRGIKHLRGYGPADNEQAVKLFQQAIELDPDYALARAYRAFADVVVHDYDGAPGDILDRAQAEVQNAVAMDPDEPRSHWLLGMIASFRGDLAAEMQHYRRGLALNPNDANIIAGYGTSLAALGQPEEGIDNIREAMRLNPYHPEWYWIVLGDAFYVAHRYEDAIEALRQKASPRIWVLARLAACYGQLGRLVEAKEIVAQVMRQKPDFSVLRQRGSAWSPEDTAHFRKGMRKAGLPE